MAKYFANGNLTFALDNTGGTPVALAAYIEEVTGAGKAFAMLDATQFTDTAPAQHVGLQEATSITIRGKFDDTAATGPHVVIVAVLDAKAARTITFSPDGTKTLSGEFFCRRYMPTARNGEMVMYEAEFISTGAVTWA